MTTYPKANTDVQWFQDNYPGSRMDPNALVVHTTESTGWPSYNGGATAPNCTARPNMSAKRLEWRAHFPDERSARALRNTSGGVETNTLNVVQLELVGTCDPKHRDRWGSLRAGRDYIYWPEAPQWALAELADFLAYLHERHGIKLSAPRFRAYPCSYGTNNGVRMTHRQWRSFYGVCGHQHVPENTHGDPGNLDMPQVLELAQRLVAPKPEAAPTRGGNVDAAVASIDQALGHARKHPVRHRRLTKARAWLTRINPH